MTELHIDLLLGDASAENIHLRLWHRHVTLADVLNFVKDFAWFSRIVSLDFCLEVITTEDLNSTFRQLAASCHKLDSLRIKLLTRQLGHNVISISFKCLQVTCHLHQAVMYRRLKRAVHPWEPASES